MTIAVVFPEGPGWIVSDLNVAKGLARSQWARNPKIVNLRTQQEMLWPFDTWRSNDVRVDHQEP